MKIVIISSHYPDIQGGVSDYTYFLSQHLSKKDNKVYVLTTNDKEIKRIQDDNLVVIPGIEKWNITAVKSIFEHINKIKPDYILLQYVPYMYSRNGVPFSMAFLAIILRLKKISLISTLHEISINLEFGSIKYFLISIFQRIIAQFISLGSYRIVLTIEPYADLIGLFKDKIRFISAGSNIIPFEFSETEKEKLKKNIAGADEVIISTFGSGLRRTDLLIEAVRILINEGISIKLIIMGRLSEKSAELLRDKIKELKLGDEVLITGYLESEDVFKYLIVTDIYVILEDVDGKGRGGISIKNTSVAAAYAAGLPIISTRGHMTDSFFQHGINIILLDKLELKALCDEIKRLISSPALRKTLRRNSISTYNSRLSWDKISSRYMELMN